MPRVFPRGIALELRGRVRRGDGVGRRLGYPTANLTKYYFRYHPVASGVYPGWAAVGRRPVPAVAVVGVDGKVEVHLLGWRGSLYGRELRVTLGRRLRPLRVYRDDRRLRRQIAVDLVRVRRALGV